MTTIEEKFQQQLQNIPALRINISYFLGKKDKPVSDEEFIRRSYTLFAPETPLERDPDHPTLIEYLDRIEATRVKEARACDNAACKSFYEKNNMVGTWNYCHYCACYGFSNGSDSGSTATAKRRR